MGVPTGRGARAPASADRGERRATTTTPTPRASSSTADTGSPRSRRARGGAARTTPPAARSTSGRFGSRAGSRSTRRSKRCGSAFRDARYERPRLVTHESDSQRATRDARRATSDERHTARSRDTRAAPRPASSLGLFSHLLFSSLLFSSLLPGRVPRRACRAAPPQDQAGRGGGDDAPAGRAQRAAAAARRDQDPVVAQPPRRGGPRTRRFLFISFKTAPTGWTTGVLRIELSLPCETRRPDFELRVCSATINREPLRTRAGYREPLGTRAGSNAGSNRRLRFFNRAFVVEGRPRPRRVRAAARAEAPPLQRRDLGVRARAPRRHQRRGAAVEDRARDPRRHEAPPARARPRAGRRELQRGHGGVPEGGPLGERARPAARGLSCVQRRARRSLSFGAQIDRDRNGRRGAARRGGSGAVVQLSDLSSGARRLLCSETAQRKTRNSY